MRNHGTTGRGGAFDQATIAAVWQRGHVIPDHDAAVWRRDFYGAPIKRSDYGNCQSQYGWEIDHIIPVAHSGADDIANLQPLQWANNRKKADNWPPAEML